MAGEAACRGGGRDFAHPILLCYLFNPSTSQWISGRRRRAARIFSPNDPRPDVSNVTPSEWLDQRERQKGLGEIELARLARGGHLSTTHGQRRAQRNEPRQICENLGTPGTMPTVARSDSRRIDIRSGHCDVRLLSKEVGLGLVRRLSSVGKKEKKRKRAVPPKGNFFSLLRWLRWCTGGCGATAAPVVGGGEWWAAALRAGLLHFFLPAC